MKTYKLTKISTALDELFNAVTIIFIGILLAGFLAVISRGNILQTPQLAHYEVAIGLLLFGAFRLVPFFRRQQLLRRHNVDISRFQSGQALPPEIILSESRMFDLASIRDIKDARDIHFTNYVGNGDWSYAEMNYSIYRHTKYGDYRAYRVYYGVMVVDLPRALPNVFFDSKQARGRQFRFHFSRNQLHGLEGNFDNYFATYFPEQYTIDSMSFISPDVMLSLIAASHYDIEIVGAKLYLYGPLGDPAIQIGDMSSKIAAIKSQLLDNILTYRDERLPYEQGRQRVTPLAMSLKRSSFWRNVSIIAGIVYFVFWLSIQIFAR